MEKWERIEKLTGKNQILELQLCELKSGKSKVMGKVTERRVIELKESKMLKKIKENGGKYRLK